jgi:hypothetical protein
MSPSTTRTTCASSRSTQRYQTHKRQLQKQEHFQRLNMGSDWPEPFANTLRSVLEHCKRNNTRASLSDHFLMPILYIYSNLSFVWPKIFQWDVWLLDAL